MVLKEEAIRIFGVILVMTYLGISGLGFFYVFEQLLSHFEGQSWKCS